MDIGRRRFEELRRGVLVRLRDGPELRGALAGVYASILAFFLVHCTGSL